MIEFDNGGRLVEDVSDLPTPPANAVLFADFETTSGDPKKKSTNPWRDCDVAGVAVRWREHQGAWYVPVGHHHGPNIPRDAFVSWWRDVLDAASEWDNQNVKYDAHVSKNCLDVDPPEKLKCLLTLSKIIDSDRIHRGGYGLDALSRDWLHEDISRYEEAMRPHLNRNKDYGAVPPDIMGEYACQDVISADRLDRFIESRCPEQCRRVWNNDIKLTHVLYEMERIGMCVNIDELKHKELELYYTMQILEERLASIVGRVFRPAINVDCYEVLCLQYGLPVVKWTEEDADGEPAGNPSFDKHALAMYRVHPDAPRDVVQMIIAYRKANTLNNFFVKRYIEKAIAHDDGTYRLHSTYNQTLRTGRMSAKDPNSQQLNEEAKELIHPAPGFITATQDASQIEFRIIAHYIRDANVIEAYRLNPDTDFHQWVADECRVHRKPAKTLNFMMGYGGGEEKTVLSLSRIPELVDALLKQCDSLVEKGKIRDDQKMTVFEALCVQRAKGLYRTYHDTLPTLKPTSRKAAQAVESRGYVFNILGRHRHVPVSKAHIAFNTICQGSAADIVKESFVDLHKVLRETFPDVKYVAQVHDEIVMNIPSEMAKDPDLRDTVLWVLEHPQVDLAVPLRWTWGTSERNWKESSKSGETFPSRKPEILSSV